MKYWFYLLVVAGLMQFIPMATATPPSNADAISWTRIPRKSGDGSDRIAVFSDGGSTIVVRRRDGKPRRTNPGWQSGVDGPFICYIKNYPFSRADAKKKYADALAAGIERLKAFPPQHPDDDVTAINLWINRQATRIEIPEFYGEGDNDNNIGSENHRRFLAVEKILGDFDTAAFLGPTLIKWLIVLASAVAILAVAKIGFRAFPKT